MGKFDNLLEKVETGASASDLGEIPNGKNPDKDDKDYKEWKSEFKKWKVEFEAWKALQSNESEVTPEMFVKEGGDKPPLYRDGYNPYDSDVIPVGSKDDGRYKGPYDDGSDGGSFFNLALSINGLGGDDYNDVDGTFRTRPHLGPFGQTGGNHGEVPIPNGLPMIFHADFITKGREGLSKFEFLSRMTSEGMYDVYDADLEGTDYEDNKYVHGDDGDDDDEAYKTVIRKGKKVKIKIRPKGQRPKMSAATRLKISRSRKRSQKVKKSAKSATTKRNRKKSMKLRKQTIR